MLKPLHDRVLVKADPIPEKVTGASGISLYIPKSEDSRPPMGTVVRVGDLVKGLKEGDRVIYQKYAPTEVWLFTKEGVRIPDLFMIKFEDIDGYDDGQGSEILPLPQEGEKVAS